jgi:RNA polymerase sigma-70 factor (ECF subfamily)
MKAVVTHSALLRVSEAIGDAELVARARTGDRWSREMLYRRHAAPLLGLAARLLSNRGEAEDVVQDTFVTAFEQLATLREPAALRGWLAQIAVSFVRRRIRKRRMLRVIGLDRGADDATLDALAAPTAPPDQRTELALMADVLRGLKTELRLAWMLRRVEGFELAEVAAACDCSLATAKRRIAAAEAVLQAHLAGARQEQGQEEGDAS